MRVALAAAGFLVCAGAAAVAQGDGAPAAADSVRQEGRPWHAAAAWRRAAARAPAVAAAMLVAGARAELDAKRYQRARSLLVGQSWLGAHADGLGVLGEAEARLGMHQSAAERFSAARDRAAGPAAALFTVRQAVALEAAGRVDEAALGFREARRLGLTSITDWLRLREARVTRDTAIVRTLLAGLAAGPRQEAARAWAAALLASGDTGAARAAYAGAGAREESVTLALAVGDSAAAREALYGFGPRGPRRDDAALVRRFARPLAPRTAGEFVILARAHQLAGAAADGAAAVEQAIALGDSTGSTLLLAGDLRAAAGRLWPAEGAYRAATRDSSVAPLAAYRRARILARLGDRGMTRALAGFADAYPGDSAAPTALFLLADYLADREDAAASQWYTELVRRYPTDPRSSLARFRLASAARAGGRPDSAAAWYRDEVARDGPHANAARFWLGRLAAEAGDSASARAEWAALAAADSLGYYGLRARAAAGLPPPAISASVAGAPPAAIAAALARVDTLRLAGLDSEMVAEVRALAAVPPADVEALLALSEGLAGRGFGMAAVRLGWLARARAPADARAVRAVYPWPNREAVTAEALEFGIEPFLFAALVRQESVFEADATSPAGARGLAQLMPATAAHVARGLDVAFEPSWITVPDLNLHLGAAHLRSLLARYRGRVDAALAAYNAGTRPVDRWLRRPGADDPDEFLEAIPYRETRGYVRAVQRNRWLYAVLYPASSP